MKHTQITSLKTYPVLRPVRPELAITSAAGRHHESRYLLVAVETNAGITGWGEFSGTPMWSGETLESARTIIEDYYAPSLRGIEADVGEEFDRRMAAGAFGNPFARAAVEMACLDALGRRAGVSAWRLYAPDAVPAPLPLRGSIGVPDAARAVARAEWFLGQGFRALKVKVGSSDPDADAARVRAVRQAIGPEIKLGMDANAGWSVEQAVGAVRALEDCGLQYVEQPVARGDFAGMAEVRRRGGLPVMADETVWTMQDVETVLHLDAADIVSLYPGKMGSIGRCRTLAARLAAAGKAVYIGSNLEMDLGAAAMAHCATGLPGFDPPRLHCDIIGPVYYTDAITAPPFRIENGFAFVPEGPGLGLEPLAEYVGAPLPAVKDSE